MISGPEDHASPESPALSEVPRPMLSITCGEFIAFLDDYVDGSLPPTRAEVFEEHLRICPDCRAYLAEYRASVELVRSLGEADPVGAVPGSVPTGLVEAVRRAMRAGA